MNMKIVLLVGSPRIDGNTALLAQRLLGAAESQGAEIRKFFVNTLDFAGCQGCESCKTIIERCVLEDELTEVLEAVKNADILILASPLYSRDIGDRLKCFFDRAYSYLKPDFSSRLKKGKKAAFILVQCVPDDYEFDDIFSRYEHWLRLFGYSPIYRLQATGVKHPGDIKRQPHILEQAGALGKELIKPKA